MTYYIERAIYEVRWYWWLLTGTGWPIQTLYFGAYRLDRASRRLIIERAERENRSREPMFRGGYPKRMPQEK